MDNNLPATSSTNQAPVQTTSASERDYKPILLVTLIIIIVALLSGVLFFDQIKTAFVPKNSQQTTLQTNEHATTSSNPTPTIEPATGLVCARYTSVSEALKNIDTTCVLDLSNQNLTELPAGVSKLTKLKAINLNNNKLTSFPDELINHTSINEIDLKNNQISKIPDTITKLTLLTKLDLSNNKITTLPQMQSMYALSNLYLSGNNISTEEKDKINSIFIRSTGPKTIVNF